MNLYEFPGGGLWVKDLVWLRSLLRRRFISQLRNFHMPWVLPKEKKKMTLWKYRIVGGCQGRAERSGWRRSQGVNFYCKISKFWGSNAQHGDYLYKVRVRVLERKATWTELLWRMRCLQ